MPHPFSLLGAFADIAIGFFLAVGWGLGDAVWAFIGGVPSRWKRTAP